MSWAFKKLIFYLNILKILPFPLRAVVGWPTDFLDQSSQGALGAASQLTASVKTEEDFDWTGKLPSVAVSSRVDEK